MRHSKYKLSLLAAASILAVINLFTLFAPVTSLAVTPTNGKCPGNYYYRDQDKSCVKLPAGQCATGFTYRDQDKSCNKTPATGDTVTASYCKSQGFDGVKDGKCYSKGQAACVDDGTYCSAATAGGDQCGAAGDDRVTTAINFGCTGKGNAIMDITFAIIRFLSNGVGLVVVGSIVFAGIQYTVSRADPQAIAAAQERIRSSIIALIIYIFAYAILNYVIPKGFLHQ